MKKSCKLFTYNVIIKFQDIFCIALFSSFLSTSNIAYSVEDISIQSMVNRLETLEKSFNMLQKYTYNLSANSASNKENYLSAHSVNSINMDEISEHLKGIHNDIEKLQQDIARINDKVLQMSSDFEQRLSSIESPIKETNEAKKVVSNIESELEEIHSPKSTNQSANSSSSTNQQPVPNSIEDEFRIAYGYLKSKNYKQAQEAFEQFIKKHPESNILGGARYWLGEIYSTNNAYDRAAVEYLKGYQVNPTGNRAADNLLRLGETLIKLDKRQEACATFMKMSKEFPSLQPSLKRQVDQIMKDISCGK